MHSETQNRIAPRYRETNRTRNGLEILILREKQLSSTNYKTVIRIDCSSGRFGFRNFDFIIRNTASNTRSDAVWASNWSQAEYGFVILTTKHKKSVICHEK